jgi:hypothetical protein
MNKRQVDISTLIRLIKQRGPVATIGLVFTLVSLLVLTPVVSFLTLSGKQPYEKYDYKKIEAQGVEMPAKITYAKVMYNVSINGEHPVVISYSYQNNGQMRNDKFETIDLEKIANLNVGDEIKIKVLGDQSKMAGVEPFSFPFGIFYIIPGIFLLVGIPFFIIGVLPAIRLYNLYKNGDVREATVVSVEPVRRGVDVNYYFTGLHQDRVFGKSRADYTYLSEKQPNDKVKIFVSERNENNSCLIPKLEALKYNWEI